VLTHGSPLTKEKAPQYNGARKKWLRVPNRFFFFSLITIIHYRHACINIFVITIFILQYLPANGIFYNDIIIFFLSHIGIKNGRDKNEQQQECFFHCCKFSCQK
jgi:hypothetical protein